MQRASSNRGWLLVATAAATALGLAGCASGGDDGGWTPIAKTGSGDNQGADPPSGTADSGAAGDSGTASGDDAAASGDDASPQPGDNGDGGEHGHDTWNGNSCVGGSGPPNDLAHVPTCPNDALAMYPRLMASRGDYYHDGLHQFEPQTVAWDNAIAAVAQQYADAYAQGGSPQGTAFSGQIGFDTFYMGTYQGYLAFAGMETPTSCDCTPGNQLNPAGGPPVFYHQGSAYFRSYVIRTDGYSRMGIGHVENAGSHYWTFLYAK